MAKYTALMLTKFPEEKNTDGNGYKGLATAISFFSLVLPIPLLRSLLLASISHSLCAALALSTLPWALPVQTSSSPWASHTTHIRQHPCAPSQQSTPRSRQPRGKSGVIRILTTKLQARGVELRVRVHLKIQLKTSCYSSVPTAGILLRKLPQVPHLLNFLSSNTLLPKFLLLLYICESSSYYWVHMTP